MAKLDRSIVYSGFRKELNRRFGVETARDIWMQANKELIRLEQANKTESLENRMMILPAAALWVAISKHEPEQALPMLKDYGTVFGNKIANIVHAVTSIPGVSKLLWKHMSRLMRKMSSPEAGYTRNIVSETDKLVGVDILSCPLHDAAVRSGMPEAAQVVCAMDKAYMTGFKHIRYTRTTSVAEGGTCCDYRLSFDPNKK